MAAINRAYLDKGRLHVSQFGRGFFCLNTSTHVALAAAARFIEAIESAHGLKIGCLEEIAYRSGYISATQLANAADEMKNPYGTYLRSLVI